jgi:hypothetical protein
MRKKAELFGNRNNNLYIYQYLAIFRPIAKYSATFRDKD